ncbi:MAG: family 10 glycosylhydrolase [Sphingomonadales bacterium]|nr:family 10 glycosylhydrolase [Sphingomonadales bacterium]
MPVYHPVIEEGIRTALRDVGARLQIRPAADALYPSRIEPWSEYLTGVQGKASSFDPLAYWIAEAHARAIDVHVWFNPFRARHPDAKSPNSAKHIASVRPDLVRSYAGHLWLDPGEPEARAHSLRVIEDVLRRYDIDGVHFDDYFYPYPINDALDDGPGTKGTGEKKQVELPFPDDASWKTYCDETPEAERMTRELRWQHGLVMLSFTVLVYTGFALTYPESWWASPLLRWETQLGSAARCSRCSTGPIRRSIS